MSKEISMSEVTIIGNFTYEGRHSTTISTKTNREPQWVEVLNLLDVWNGNTDEIVFRPIEDHSLRIFQPHRHEPTAQGIICIFDEYMIPDDLLGHSKRD